MFIKPVTILDEAAAIHSIDRVAEDYIPEEKEGDTTTPQEAHPNDNNVRRKIEEADVCLEESPAQDNIKLLHGGINNAGFPKDDDSMQLRNHNRVELQNQF